jgi:hypothetical protein
MELVWQRHAVRNSRAFLKHVVPAVVKPARTLWNEVIGFLFICLAVVFGAATVRSYIDFTKAAPDAGGGFFLRVVMGSCATSIVLYYGISSFLRARRISRS